jgi:c-di-GMP-binding flagellar brake protein YcgR
MSKRKINYEQYFKEGQQVKVGIRFSATHLRESNGEITAFSKNRARVEILGSDAPRDLSSLQPGSRVTLSGWSGWGFYCCEAVILEIISAKEFDLRLEGDIDEIQRREYFRLDVSLPVAIEIPPQQTIASLSEQWEKRTAKHQNEPLPRMLAAAGGYRIVAANGQEIPSQDVNLSGGGMRLRLPSAVSLGTRIHVDLYLPMAPLRIISTVAEVLRCNEVTLRIEKAPVFIVALKFILIEEKDREAIIAYLFSEQRIQLQSESNRELPSP